jgi:hypothetical protein
MRSRIFVSTCLLVAMLVPGALATDGDHGPALKAATVYLTEPTLVGSTIVQGPVVFIHDDTKMALGEPCTTVKLVEPGRGPLEEIASFRCIPTPRAPVNKFTLRTRPNTELGFGCVLTEFQFAGEHEGHGVPLTVLAH